MAFYKETVTYATRAGIRACRDLTPTVLATLPVPLSWGSMEPSHSRRGTRLRAY